MVRGGKDSTANILLALENNIKIDEVIYVDLVFDRTKHISCVEPLHSNWIHNVAIPKLEAIGLNVNILRSPLDFKHDLFYRKSTSKNPLRTGKYCGFPLGNMCMVARDLKMKPINLYLKYSPPAVQYIGIATDEANRRTPLTIKKQSLLVKYNITEQQALLKSKEYNLLSPRYAYGFRDGCFFCPNCSIKEYARIAKTYPELWAELEELSKEPNVVSKGFSYGKTFTEVNRRVEMINNQISIWDMEI